ncbi:MAG: UDP-glucose 6-dehydrogenase [Rhodobacter sp.]|nr:UDP-glucose 6-dehydrogenase [Paracoccaceae bacterium]MCC0076473.1 UDP-glucose 6-dehydrogenase [Rhodobacter sp.]
MKIAVIGLGVVALSDALALARNNDVVVTGPVPERVDAINAGLYPLSDPSVAAYVAANALSLRATLDTAEALDGAEVVMISSPLSLDPATGAYRTVELESRIEMAYRLCPGVPIVIRSAVPIGFTQRLRESLGARSILCAPEFTREAQSLEDALNPRFIIVGDRGPLGSKVSAVLLGAAQRPGVPVKLMGAAEAEAVKHFSQAYLAARVAYFNELDSYALAKGLNARQVIDGVCLDPRIGAYANNPCFGYGGHRLPRSAQLLSESFGGVPAHVVPTVARANDTRISLLASKVLERAPQRIGVYHPGAVTADSDPLLALRDRLVAAGAEVDLFTGQDGDDFARFKDEHDLVVAQRLTPELRDIRGKVFSRDLYASA